MVEGEVSTQMVKPSRPSTSLLLQRAVLDSPSLDFDTILLCGLKEPFRNGSQRVKEFHVELIHLERFIH